MLTEDLLLSLEAAYHDEFETREDVFNAFSVPNDPKYQILYAGYERPDYEGYAKVFGYDTEKKKFFDVHGSHCSCYGLEDQWDPDYYDNFEHFVARMRQYWERLGDKNDPFIVALFSK